VLSEVWTGNSSKWLFRASRFVEKLSEKDLAEVGADFHAKSRLIDRFDHI